MSGSERQQKEYQSRLRKLMRKEENLLCVDCSSPRPSWASLLQPPPGAPLHSVPVGAFCCINCSGAHRRLGVHIAFVRSIELDTWSEKEVSAMERGGNFTINGLFEVHKSPNKPKKSSSNNDKFNYIREKYELRKFFDHAEYAKFMNGENISASSNADLDDYIDVQKSTKYTTTLPAPVTQHTHTTATRPRSDSNEFEADDIRQVRNPKSVILTLETSLELHDIPNQNEEVEELLRIKHSNDYTPEKLKPTSSLTSLRGLKKMFRSNSVSRFREGVSKDTAPKKPKKFSRGQDIWGSNHSTSSNSSSSFSWMNRGGGGGGKFAKLLDQ